MLDILGDSVFMTLASASRHHCHVGTINRKNRSIGHGERGRATERIVYFVNFRARSIERVDQKKD